MGDEVEQLLMLEHPALQRAPFRFGRHVLPQERQQLAHEPVARLLERVDRALEPLEEVRSDEPDDLLLSVVLPRVDVLVVARVEGERVVDREAEERLVALERLLEQIDEPPVALTQGIRSHDRGQALRKRRGLGPAEHLALLGVRAAALHDESLEQGVLGEDLLKRLGGVGHLAVRADLRSHLVREGVHAGHDARDAERP
jgi:hypothetical protein